MSGTVIVLEAWCACGGSIKAEVGSVEAMETIHSVFRSLHEAPGCGSATKEQAARARRNQGRRSS